MSEHCIQNDALLEQYVDGELESAEAGRVEAALANCEHCSDYLADLAVVQGAVKKSIAEAVEAAPLDQLWSRIEGELERAKVEAGDGLIERIKGWLQPAPLRLAMGACALLIAVLAAIQMMDSTVKQESPDRVVASSAVPVKNTLVVESVDVTQGTVVIDVDPDEVMPAIVWHFVDDEREDG